VAKAVVTEVGADIYELHGIHHGVTVVVNPTSKRVRLRSFAAPKS
jgi:hypothetical protein